MRPYKKRKPAIQKMALSILLAVLFFGLFLGCDDSDDDYSSAKAYQITDRAHLIGGPKALGSIGDFMLENDKIRVIINGHATDMSGGGINKWGGSIIDADIQRFEDFFDPAVSGYDQLLEIVPMMDVKFFGVDSYLGSGPVLKIPQDAVEVLNDGSDGGEARIRVKGVNQNLIWLLSIVPVPLNNLPVQAETIYSLKPGDNYVKLTTTYTLLNKDGSQPETTHEVPLRPLQEGDNPLFSIVTGDVFGDGLFYGDSVDVIGPGLFGFAPGWFQEELFKQGKSTLLDTPMIEWSAGSSGKIGYGIVSPDAPLAFPIMESFLTIAFQKVTGDGFALPFPGGTYTFSRYLIVDEGDIAGILDHVVDLKKWRRGLIKGNVYHGGSGRAATDVDVLLFEHPRFADGSLVPVKKSFDEMNQFLMAQPIDSVSTTRLIPYSRFVTDVRRLDNAADGSFEGKVPVDNISGESHYLIMASGPANVKSQLLPFTLEDGETENVSLILPETATLKVTVKSQAQTGPYEPCKVMVQSLHGEGKPDPFLGESYLQGGLVKHLLTLDGRVETKLPPGEYRVIAGRGPEYSADEKTIKLNALETREVELSIARVVDTGGWVAIDTHMHTHISPDSGLTTENRLKSALSEGLDFITGTDHDAIPNFRPVLEEMGMLEKLVVAPGNELSHFSYAHFCGWPLRYDAEEISGGATQWRSPSPTATLPDGSPNPEYTPQDCFDSLRGMTNTDMIDQDAVVVANHTEESFTGYLRAFGFEQFYARFDSPDFLTIGNPTIHGDQLFSSDGSKNFSFDFDAIEVLNAKRWQDIRTATEEEINEAEIGQPKPAETPYLPTIVRTSDEQLRIIQGDLILDHTNRGGIDDYFTLQAMGLRKTAIGASDSHSQVKTENGKCRTYVMASNDDPRFLDVDQMVTNLKANRAVATNGPFVELWVNGNPIGAEIHDSDGVVNVRIRAQAPPWMSFNRIEIYGNGVLIGEIGNESNHENFMGCETLGKSITGNDKVLRFDDTVRCHISADTFINVIGIGYEGMTPHRTPVDGPAVEIDDTLVLGINQLLQDWLGVSNLLPIDGTIQRNHDIYPYAFTNAVYVDTDGDDYDMDGYDYDGPGYLPGFFDEDDLEQKRALMNRPDVQNALFAAKNRILSITDQIHGTYVLDANFNNQESQD